MRGHTAALNPPGAATDATLPACLPARPPACLLAYLLTQLCLHACLRAQPFYVAPEVANKVSVLASFRRTGQQNKVFLRFLYVLRVGHDCWRQKKKKKKKLRYFVFGVSGLLLVLLLYLCVC